MTKKILLNKQRIAKYKSVLKLDEIKKKNIDFLITYTEPGSLEQYTDRLNYSEIQNPEPGTVSVKKIDILGDDENRQNLTVIQSKKILTLLSRQKQG